MVDAAPDPHLGQPLRSSGASLLEARAAMVLIHGRGATADGILSLAAELDHAAYAYLAPQAAGNTWYPYSFLEPLEVNEPFLSSALGVIEDLFDTLQNAGLGPERTILLGFSQGACLALEYAARRARRYGGVVGLSGGLIGPDGTPRDYSGSLDGTPVFLGCGDPDPHIPAARVDHTGSVLAGLGAAVDKRFYPGLGHTVNQDELSAVKTMMQSLLAEV